MQEFKVVILGSSGVGKSALTVQIEDIYRKEIKADKFPYILAILDTADTEQYTRLRDLHINVAQGFIIVYSLASYKTFENIRTMKEIILRTKTTEHVQILLVANKLDLEHQREVSTAEGNDLAKLWGCSFIEASARNGTNIYDVFAEIVREISFNPANEKKSYYCCPLL